MSSKCTIGHVLAKLRRRRLIADLRRVRYQVFHAGAPTLKDTDILELVGIANNTTLHVRACVLGGMPMEQPRENAAQGGEARTSFNKQTGEFSSQHPESECWSHSFISLGRLARIRMAPRAFAARLVPLPALRQARTSSLS